jgi:hypothetical protein
MTVENKHMNNIAQDTQSGTCTGTVGGVSFTAGMVELTTETYPVPVGEAHVMFARQREPGGATKEINLAFSKGASGDLHFLEPGSLEVRLSFVDRTDPNNPVIYTQAGGQIALRFNETTGTLTGNTTNAVVENEDDNDVRKLDLKFIFNATSDASRHGLLKRRAA